MALNGEKRPLIWEEALAEREAKGRATGTREVIGRASKHRFHPEASELAEIETKLAAISDLGRLHEILELAVKADRIEDIDLG